MARKNENLVLKYIYSVLISHLLVISRSKRSIRKWNRRMSNFLTHIYIVELAGINYEQMIILFEYFWGSGQSLCVKSVQILSFFWSIFSCFRTEYRKIRTRNNFIFGHFSRSQSLSCFTQYFGVRIDFFQKKSWIAELSSRFSHYYRKKYFTRDIRWSLTLHKIYWTHP